MKSLPTEILQEIIQYSDTLIRVILDFPIDKEILLEEGGPGKVLDEFLRRNGNLEHLKEWILGECALTYGVNTKDPKKILEIDRVWNANMFSNQGFIFSVNMNFKWGMENICHDVEEPVQYLAITKQWEKIRKQIMTRDCHPKYLMDAPETKLGKGTLDLLSIYKGGKADSSAYLINACLFHKMYEEAVRIGKETGHDIIPDIIFLHDVKAFKHTGIE